MSFSHCSLTTYDSLSLISVGANGCDWHVAAGQSKLLRPALYLAITAFSLSLSLPPALSPSPSPSPSCFLLHPLPQQSLAHLGRRVNRIRSVGGGKQKGKITQRQMWFVEMDGNGGRMSAGKWEKELWSIREKEGEWQRERADELHSKHFAILHLPPALQGELSARANMHTTALYLRTETFSWRVCVCVQH